MTLTETQYALWFAGFAAHALLASVMLRGSYRRWPSLFALAIFEMGLTLTLMAVHHHCVTYWYIFQVGAVVRPFIGLWLVFDVISAIPNIKYAPRSLALGFLSLAIALAIGSAWLASSGGTHTFHLEMMASTLHRCMQILWGTFTITLFAGVGSGGLGWTPTPLRMAASVLVLILISCADAWIISKWPVSLYPHLNLRVDEVFNLCIIAVRLSWVLTMRKEESDAPQGAVYLPITTACRER